jgi:predicted DNA-binding transcriptional regulator AlpA
LCRGYVQRRPALWKSFRASRKPFRDRAKTVRLPAGIAVRVQPGILFAFTPESFSRSPRNPVRLAPESAFRERLAKFGLELHADKTRLIEFGRFAAQMERLNLRIVELEHQNRQQAEPISKSAVTSPPAVDPTGASTSSLPKQPTEMLNDMHVADYLNMSVATLRRWRLFRKGPKFVKIGSAVRYKRGDVETWMDSLPGLR